MAPLIVLEIGSAGLPPWRSFGNQTVPGLRTTLTVRSATVGSRAPMMTLIGTTIAVRTLSAPVTTRVIDKEAQPVLDYQS